MKQPCTKRIKNGHVRVHVRGGGTAEASSVSLGHTERVLEHKVCDSDLRNK